MMWQRGAWAAEIQRRVFIPKGVRLGAARSPGWPPGQAAQRRISPLGMETPWAGANCGAIRRCRLVVGARHTPPRRLDWPRNSPRRGLEFLPPTLLAPALLSIFLLLSGTPALAQALAQAPQLYRCGPEGRLLTDRPCPPGQASSQSALPTDPVDPAQTEAARRRAAADARAAEQLQRQRERFESQARPGAAGLSTPQPASSPAQGSKAKAAQKKQRKPQKDEPRKARANP